MTGLHSSPAAAASAKGTLYLQFCLNQQRFALDVHDVIEVLPRRPLKPIAQAPAWVAGILAHRGVLVPVIDLGALSFGQPAAERTSTRLVLVRYRGDQVLGLILNKRPKPCAACRTSFSPMAWTTTKRAIWARSARTPKACCNG